MSTEWWSSEHMNIVVRIFRGSERKRVLNASE